VLLLVRFGEEGAAGDSWVLLQNSFGKANSLGCTGLLGGQTVQAALLRRPLDRSGSDSETSGSSQNGLNRIASHHQSIFLL